MNIKKRKTTKTAIFNRNNNEYMIIGIIREVTAIKKTNEQVVSWAI